MNYSQLRTGLTWQAIRDELTAEQDTARNAGTYFFVSRATVLGRWHQHKRKLWDELPDDVRGDEHA